MYVILLLLLVAVSFGAIGFLIGSTGNDGHYTGRIIDVISIGSGGMKDDDVPSMDNIINIRGRVVYTDDTPYRNGKVELRSTPRYTITDDDGRFEFTDVAPGEHKITVFRDDIVVATCSIEIEREPEITSAQIVKLADANYIILTPLNLPEIDLVLSVLREDDPSAQEQGLIEVTLSPTQQPGPSQPPGEVSPGETPAPTPTPSPVPTDPRPTPTPTLPPSPKPTYPVPTPIPTPSPVPTESPGPGIPSGAPNVSVSDDILPNRVWATLTTVDLFAERSGNFGVQTINGKNVIKPGSHGSYIFRIKNPEAWALEYLIDFSEADENNPRLPMKYRLRQGTSGTNYIGGSDWRGAGSISLDWTQIPAGDVSDYTLEWKWDSSDDAVDTAIGMQDGTPVYILNILITAKFQ